MSDDIELLERSGQPAHGLDMMTWLHTEGGRKCPMCGRYAKPRELGWIGASGPCIRVDAYGHLPGFGCNKAKDGD